MQFKMKSRFTDPTTLADGGTNLMMGNVAGDIDTLIESPLPEGCLNRIKEAAEAGTLSLNGIADIIWVHGPTSDNGTPAACALASVVEAQATDFAAVLLTKFDDLTTTAWPLFNRFIQVYHSLVERAASSVKYEGWETHVDVALKSWVETRLNQCLPADSECFIRVKDFVFQREGEFEQWYKGKDPVPKAMPTMQSNPAILQFLKMLGLDATLGGPVPPHACKCGRCTPKSDKAPKAPKRAGRPLSAEAKAKMTAAVKSKRAVKARVGRPSGKVKAKAAAKKAQLR